MGWNIGVLENTLQVPKDNIEACNTALMKTDEGPRTWDNGPVQSKGNIYFSRDDYEHMDYLARADVCDVFKTFKAQGEVIFLSAEGDNKGEVWGYQFDGQGGMKTFVLQLVVQLAGFAWVWKDA
jgi:hypothetical protein